MSEDFIRCYIGDISFFTLRNVQKESELEDSSLDFLFGLSIISSVRFACSLISGSALSRSSRTKSRISLFL